MLYSYLQDKEFLEQLDQKEHREIYARVTSLDINENPIEYIEGRLTAGSINIDGSSTVRRTCNLTLVSQNLDINDFYWGIKTKIKVEIGLKNTVGDILKNHYTYEKDSNGNTLYYYTASNGVEYRSHYTMTSSGIYEIDGYIDSNNNMVTLDDNQKQFIVYHIKDNNPFYEKNPYPDILWFPQGIFIISAFNSSIQANGQTVTINGKDKMCMLNGDLGGQLTASIDFGQEEMVDYIYTPHNFSNIKDYTSHKYYFPTGEYVKYKGNFSKYQTYYTKNGASYSLANINYFSADTDYYVRKYSLADSSYNPNRTYYDKEEIITKIPIPIKKIIREAVHAWAGEPYQNIIINDLDDFGLEQLVYTGDKTLYCFKPIDDDVYRQLSTNSSAYVYILPRAYNELGVVNGLNQAITDYFNASIRDSWPRKTIAEAVEDGIITDTAAGGIAERSITDLTWIIREGSYNVNNHRPSVYVIRLLNYGEDAGYRTTDLIYAGELIAAIGDTITSVLDKIKNMLGNFEYFYNLDGQFVFQKKQTYIDTSWSAIKKVEGDTMIIPSALTSSSMYSFIGNKLISAFQNTPNIANMRNDYSVWGVRKGISGIDIPVHMRYAIDKKPIIYTNYNGETYGTVEGFEILDTLREELQELNQIVYNKAPIPDWLSETSNLWWDLTDWAEYYKLLTGDYPASRLMDYGVEGFHGTINFPGGYVAELGNQLIFDYNTDTQNPYFENWSPFMHGFNGCGHTYSEFLDWQTTKPNFKSFIYHPFIPSDVIGHYSETIFPDGSVIFSRDADYIVDWREIIYQMAIDYFANNEKDDFLPTIAKNNPVFYPTGYTGYEQYYTDIQGFWRQLYNPDAKLELTWSSGYYSDSKTNENPITGTYDKEIIWNDGHLVDVNCDYFLPGTEDSDGDLNNDLQGYGGPQGDEYELIIDSYSDDFNDELEEKVNKIFVPNGSNVVYWNRAVFESPDTLNFWFDFLEDDSSIGAFSVPQVGDRTKVLNDSKVSGIYFKEVPHFIFTSTSNINRDAIEEKTGYSWIFLSPAMEKLFTISYRGKSAKDEIDNLVYQYSYCVENITITALPVYYLQPNTRIFVKDEKTGIDGEYIISKITIPLIYNGTMSITASKAPERII